MSAALANDPASTSVPELGMVPVERGRDCGGGTETDGGAGVLEALRNRRRTAGGPHRESQEADLDGIVEYLQRHAHDPEAVRRAASALRHTVEASLWQSVRLANSRLPFIHAELIGKASGLYVENKLRRVVRAARRWLVMLSSPKRMLWAVQAAWRGDDVADYVRARDEWHTVDEVTLVERSSGVPITRVGDTSDPPPDEWLAANPQFGVITRYLAREPAADEDPAAERTWAGSETMVVVGERCEVRVRVSGHPPGHLKGDLQELCNAADAVLGDKAAGRAEFAFRLNQLALPLLKKKGPFVAEQFWNPITLLTVCLTGSAAILGSAGVEHLRWERMVRQLDSEPGIEVIHHSSVWGRRQIDMMRDPLARSPAEVLLGMGWNPARVNIRERPFVSAEEPLFAARQQVEFNFARRISDETRASHDDMKKLVDQTSAALAKVRVDHTERTASPAAISQEVLSSVRADLVRTLTDMPADLELSVLDGVLVARGKLAEPAWSRLADAPRTLSWLKGADLTGVRDLTGENITKLSKDLEKMHVAFVPASAILPEASKLRLQSVASEINLLASELKLKHRTVRMRFCAAHSLVDAGMTRQRVEMVQRELERQGVPPELLDSEGGFLEAPGPHSIAFKIVTEPSPSPS